MQPTNIGATTDGILLTVAEQLKVPLNIIARRAELARLTGQGYAEALADVGMQAESALVLLDNYALGLELLGRQEPLDVEPVSISAILTDTAHELGRFTKRLGLDVELRIAGRYGPAMAHGAGLKAAFLSLGYALAEGQAAQASGRPRLTLGVHRATQGLVAGVYGTHTEMTSAQWRQSLQLCGKAAQPCSGAVDSTAGLFIADTLFKAMAVRLRPGRFSKQYGMAATFQPSRQLAFV